MIKSFLMGCAVAIVLLGCGGAEVMEVEQARAASLVEPEPVCSRQAPLHPSAMDSQALMAAIARYSAMAPDQALGERDRLLQSSRLGSMLELIVLDLFGPKSLQSPERAQQRLSRLSPHPESLLTSDALGLIELLIDHRLELQRVHEQWLDARQKLADEQAEHDHTREKLDALRQIERDIGNRNGPNSDSRLPGETAVEQQGANTNGQF